MSVQMCQTAAQPGLLHSNISLQPQMISQVAALSQSVSQFIYQCGNVLSSLNSAVNIEHADSSTSNYSLTGWFITNLSNQQNHQAANEVDALRQEACRINQMMASMRVALPPLDTCLDGNMIRCAEENEHSHPFLDWMIGGNYSSIASMNTAGQLQRTAMRVEFVRNQAQSLLSALHYNMPAAYSSVGY
jgi:hypothetical protein